MSRWLQISFYFVFFFCQAPVHHGSDGTQVPMDGSETQKESCPEAKLHTITPCPMAPGKEEGQDGRNCRFETSKRTILSKIFGMAILFKLRF